MPPHCFSVGKLRVYLKGWISKKGMLGCIDIHNLSTCPKIYGQILQKCTFQGIGDVTSTLYIFTSSRWHSVPSQTPLRSITSTTFRVALIKGHHQTNDTISRMVLASFQSKSSASSTPIPVHQCQCQNYCVSVKCKAQSSTFKAQSSGKTDTVHFPMCDLELSFKICIKKI